MKRNLSSMAVLISALVVFHTADSVADAVCGFATCPGAPLPGAGPLPAPISVPEGQNILVGAFVVPGDTQLLDVGGSIGDVLRFSGDGVIFLFSDNPGTEPTDIGIPLPGLNLFVMPEIADTAPFTAAKYTAGVPGAQNTYFVLSDVSPVPDVPIPSTVWSLGSAIVGLVGIARRRVAG